MDEIFFLLLAFLTVFFSIKLSYYGDLLSKTTKVGAAFIGGILIASVTSLPELVTSFSAVALDNMALSFGDIVGSNMFNIFVLGVYNIYFFNSNFFKNTEKKYIFECSILLIDYIFIILGCNNIITNYISLILIIMYIIYMISVFKNQNEEENIEFTNEKFLLLKFIISAISMVFLSIFLTKSADNIASTHPNFSSSSIGAILLGITTSLPEVVTTFELIKLKNYNMATSNMLGSNIFNFLVLAISSFLIKDGVIFNFSDNYTLYYVFGGLLITTLYILSLFFKEKPKIFYMVISLVMIILYFYVWYLQFV